MPTIKHNVEEKVKRFVQHAAWTFLHNGDVKLLSALLACVAVSPAFADTYVRGYQKADGTYVAPHYQTAPNAIRSDNYSSQGNTNPYTGQRGYERNEYSNPPAYNQPSPSLPSLPDPYSRQRKPSGW